VARSLERRAAKRVAAYAMREEAEEAEEAVLAL
jgi:hypothetical protein